MSDPIISRVYDVKISGFDDALQKMTALSKAMADIDAKKQQLNKTLNQKISIGNTDDVQQLSAQLKDLDTQMDLYSQHLNAASKEAEVIAAGTEKSANAYQQLIEQYKTARDQSLQLTAQFGKESEEAQKAAASAAGYKQQIQEINDFVKQGGQQNITTPGAAPKATINDTSTLQTTSQNKQAQDIAASFDQLIQKYKEASAEYRNFLNTLGAGNQQTTQAATTTSLYKEQIQENITAIKNERTELQQYIETAQQNNQSSFTLNGQSFTTDEAVQRVAELRSQEEQLAQTFKTVQSSEEALNTAQEKLSFSQSDTAKTLAQYKVQQQLSDQQNKQIAQSTLGLIDDYGLLKKEYNDAANAAKNLASISLKTGSPEDAQAAQAAVEKAKALHDSLLQIEQSVGQSQRNVGNYTESFKILQQALTDTKSKLDQMSESERNNTSEGQQLQKQVGLLGIITSRQSEGFTTLSREIAQSTQALAEMQAAGLGGTPAFEALQIQISETTKKLNEFRANQKILSSESPGLASLTAAARGLGAAYAIGAGASSLFADGNEKLQKDLTQLVAVMTVLQGLTELSNFLKEKSAIATVAESAANKAWNVVTLLKNFILTGNTKATVENTVATQENAAAQGELSIATKLASGAMTGLRFALIATGIGALLVFLPEIVKAMSSYARSTDDAARNQQNLIDINTKAVQSYSDEVTHLDLLVAEYKNVNTSASRKLEIQQELQSNYPSYFADLDKHADKEKFIAEQADKVTQALIIQSKVQGAQQILSEKFQDVLKKQFDPSSAVHWYDILKSVLKDPFSNPANQAIDLGKTAQKNVQEATDEYTKLETFIKGFIENSNSDLAKLGGDPKDPKTGIINNLKNQIAALEKIQPTLLTDADIAKNVAQIKKLQDQLDRLTGKNNQAGSKLDIAEQEAIKIIDANKDRLLAIENTSFNEILKIHDASYDEEKAHILKTEQINVDALNQKVALLQRKKNLNAEEKKDLADFNEQITQAQLDANSKISALNKKAFDDQDKNLKARLDAAKSLAQAQNQQVQDDPTKSGFDKAVAEQQLNDRITKITNDFYKEEIALAIKFKQDTTSIEQQRQKDLADLAKNGADDRLKIAQAASKDQQDFAQELLDAINTETAQKASNILGDSQLSNIKKAKQLGDLQIEQQKKLLKQQADNDANALLLKKQQYQDGLASYKDYISAVDKAAQSHLTYQKFVTDNETSYFEKFRDSLKNILGNLTNFAKGVKASQQDINAALQDAQNIIGQTIKEAEQDYFKSQSSQIDAENTLAKKRLDIQEQQVLSLAQSQAQRDSITKEYQVKAEEQDKIAAEKKKKLALEQAAIDFAAAVINTLAQYPFPFSLIPVAALTVEYLVQRASIQAQQFAEGGKVKPEKIPNGKINTWPNIPKQHNGDNIFATVKQGEVILNEEQQRKLGGPAVFKSIGVPGFAEGGRIGNYVNDALVFKSLGIPAFADGGFTGLGDFPFSDTLRPPQNPSSFLNTTTNGIDVRDLKKMIADTQDSIHLATQRLSATITQTNDSVKTVARQTNQRIDKIKVINVAKETDKINQHLKKAANVGTI